ncbi:MULTISPECIES: hypothetical protein [unclassified Herbaspirillum]|uniref:hypothetical protein n=1 Tax=unclassified Herbaspirillum TaxID=2624150 RepID=UPI0011535ACD|nr:MULTISPECIES: hypothetical protein [unclassified Herbaspirillum]MBB5389909.1 hypothetical protein [Herbaspirillum sp. SJZ102]
MEVGKGLVHRRSPFCEQRENFYREYLLNKVGLRGIKCGDGRMTAPVGGIGARQIRAACRFRLLSPYALPTLASFVLIFPKR